MIPFIPLAIAAALGGFSGLFSASGEAARNKQAATAAAQRRQNLERLIKQIDEFRTDAPRQQAAQQYASASDQIEANAAGRGTFRSGQAGPGALKNQTLTDILAGLAQGEMARQAQAQQLKAGILSDESFGVPNPDNLQDPALAGLLGFLGGAVGTGGQGAGNFLGTDAGLQMLGYGNQPNYDQDAYMRVMQSLFQQGRQG